MSDETQKTILLVEDEVIIAMAEKMTLEKFGYRVLAVHHGEDAVTTVARTPGIDLILMDIDLGKGMDGTEAAAIILKERDLPIVFLSSHMEPEIVAKTEKITSYGYVVKDSSGTVLDASIKMAFKLFEAKMRETEKETALAHSKALMQYVIEHMSSAVAVHDRELRYIFVSQRYLDDFKLKERDIIGKYHYDVFPDLPQKWRDVHQRALAGEIIRAEDDPFQRQDGSLEWTRWECRPWYEADGSIGGIIVYTELITERKVTEIKLAQSHDLFTKLARLVPGVIYQYRLDPDGRSAFPYASPGMNDIYEVTPEEVRDDATAVFARLHPDDYDRVVGAIQASALTLNPFYCEFRVLLPRQGLRWRWSQAHPERLADGGTLWHGIISDITERKLANNAIKESELRLKAQYRGMPIPTFTWRKKGEDFELIDFNDAAKTITHEKTSEFVGRKASDLYAGRQDILHDLQQCSIEGIVIKRETLSEHFIPGKCISLTIVPIPPDLIMVHIEDIGERKRAEDVIQNSLRFQQELLDAVPSPIFYKDANFVYIGGNKAFERYLGLEREQFIGKTVFEIVPADLAKTYDQADRELLKKQGVQVYEGSVVYGDGTRHEVIFHKAPFNDAKGNIVGLIGVILDISERKRAEEALRISEAQQSNALQMTHAGHWEYDVERDVFTFNDNFYRIFRTTAAAVGGYQMSSTEYARRFCHPDDMGMVGNETRAAIKTTDPNYSRQIEHRILYADGEVGHIAVRFFVVKDAQGRTIKTYGVNQDISNRKQAQQEIQQQLTEKEILLREVHHRIKNNIASIGGLLSLHLQTITSPEAVAALQDAIGRIDSMRLLYEKLLLGKDFQDASVKNYIESLAASVVSLFPDLAKVKLNLDVVDFKLDPKQLFPLGIIINELLTNIMKYAFAGKKSGAITLALAKDGSRVTLNLEDNGVGLPSGFDLSASKGFGLTLVKMLSQQLGGSFTIEKHKGTRCRLDFVV